MKEGMFLEMVVECLQKLLISDGIEVRRNEKFYKERELIGEVDVVLRGKFGSTDMIVGIECRDRQSPQGRDWIREIIGKREDLAEFGFKHWIAVSASGFTSTAEKLAKKTNIELLVPAKMEPMEPNKYGPHTWMQFAPIYSGWYESRIIADIDHDDEIVLDQVQDYITREGWRDILVNNTNERFISLRDFIMPEVDVYNQDIMRMKRANFEDRKVFHFYDLECIVEGIPITVRKLEVEVTFYRQKIIPSFRIIAFVVPGSLNVLGVIGINEYQIFGNTAYLIVAMKIDDVKNIIVIHRDSQGKPIPSNLSFVSHTYPKDTPVTLIKYSLKP